MGPARCWPPYRLPASPLARRSCPQGNSPSAIGGVAHRPWRLTSMETALVGKALDIPTLRDTIVPALAAVTARSGSETKMPLAARSLERAVLG
jgi:CO/xanthine dehydrogenase FAD-binding subunit